MNIRMILAFITVSWLTLLDGSCHCSKPQPACIGPTGPTGPAGAKGHKGKMGHKGAKGLTGSTGPTGASTGGSVIKSLMFPATSFGSFFGIPTSKPLGGGPAFFAGYQIPLFSEITPIYLSVTFNIPHDFDPSVGVEIVLHYMTDQSGSGTGTYTVTIGSYYAANQGGSTPAFPSPVSFTQTTTFTPSSGKGVYNYYTQPYFVSSGLYEPDGLLMLSIYPPTDITYNGDVFLTSLEFRYQSLFNPD